MNRPIRIFLAEHILKQFSGNLLSKLTKPKILTLKSFGLHITTDCNYNCVYCYAENYRDNRLSLEKILSLIDEAKVLGAENINLLGGEPFLNQNLDKIVRHIDNKHMRIILFTNGSLITDSWIKFFRKIKKVVLIIKYDYDENLYAQHSKSTHTLASLEATIAKLIKNKISVVTFTVVTKRNINFIDDILSRSVRLGAYPKLHQYIPIVTRDPQLNRELEVSPFEWSGILKKLSYVYAPLEKFIYALGAFKFGICSSFAHDLYVTVNGYVLPCPESPLELNLGNVLDSSLKEIWMRFKEKRAEWIKIPSECNICSNKNICLGGCKVYTYIRFKDFDKKDPLCCDEIPTTYSHCVYALSRILPRKPSYKFLRIIK